ncbi:GbsR/MarR family transcriptional regulator [Amycolatopsis sp. NPDC051758]|uniref:GbsR/MarR family transcriptional regulator n=1 Tax=Amycolatopsis sp. NPDC051758 TaxID=3363935 RepID=UPI003798C5F9
MTAAEEFALTLTQHGLQRMTARVLAALLFSEQETTTAGDIADQLGASRGSVSTAIKALEPVGLIERVPAPGSRREHYRFPADGWARLMSTQNAVVGKMQRAAERGIEAAGDNSRAAQRLANMRDFYAYIMRELPAVIDRWRAGEAETPRAT